LAGDVTTGEYIRKALPEGSSLWWQEWHSEEGMCRGARRKHVTRTFSWFCYFSGRYINYYL